MNQYLKSLARFVQDLVHKELTTEAFSRPVSEIASAVMGATPVRSIQRIFVISR